MPNTVTTSMAIAGDIKKVADDLFWCTREKYFAEGNMVLRGGNEMLSLYSRPNAEDAAQIAAGMNAVLDPIRKRRVRELLDRLQEMTEELSKSDF